MQRFVKVNTNFLVISLRVSAYRCAGLPSAVQHSEQGSEAGGPAPPPEDVTCLRSSLIELFRYLTLETLGHLRKRLG